MDDLRLLNVLTHSNLPYEKYITAGYFRVKVTKKKDSDGFERYYKSTQVTNKGLTFLNKLLDKWYADLSIAN